MESESTQQVIIHPLNQEYLIERVKFLNKRYEAANNRITNLQRLYDLLKIHNKEVEDELTETKSKLEETRKRNLPKMIYCVPDKFLLDHFDEQLEMIINLTRENAYLYINNASLAERIKEAEKVASYSDDMAVLYTKEIEDLHNEVGDLKVQLRQLQGKLEAKELEIESIKSQNTNPILFQGDESDLYQDEIKDTILEILENNLETHESDSRSYHIISSILKANKKGTTKKKLRERIIQVFRNFSGYDRCSASEKKEIKDMGFEIVSLSNHIKAIFKGDERYWITLAKTSSCNHAGKNTMFDILKKVL